MTEIITHNHTLRSMLKVSLPLIFSSFGWALMITCDRIMLAKFDLQVMNAVAALGSLLFLFECSIVSITVTSEIFSGQYNGLGKKEMAPVATWQMLFFSASSLILFIPAGLFLGKYIIPEIYYQSAGNFFKILMCFLVFSPANAAINGFFIGIKKTKIILFNTLFTNLLNIILSYLFIFGIKDYLAPQGALGAAIATSIALIVQFTIIFLVFLNHKGLKLYKTFNYSLNKEIFLKCLKLGVPSSFAMIGELVGNYVIQLIIIAMIPLYVSNHTIALNVFIFVSFLINGIHKAVSGLAANIIGANKLELIPKLLKSAIYLHCLFTLIVVIFTVVFAEATAKLYSTDPEIIYYTKLTLPWIAGYFFCDGLGWIISGVTIAGGDTKFMMYANTLVVWLTRVAPLYILLKLEISFVAIGWIISCISGTIYSIIFYYRYKSKKWLKMQLS